MAKNVQFLFIACLIVALCSAEAPRSRISRFQNKRNRFLARQEAEQPAVVTPYPSADELKPEVPFDEAAAAEEQPSQPDEVYGPPEEETPIETDDASPSADEEVGAEEESSPAAEEESAGAEEEEPKPARLTARRTASIRRSSVRPAKLRKATPARLQLQPQFVPQPLFYYVAQ